MPGILRRRRYRHLPPPPAARSTIAPTYSLLASSWWPGSTTDAGQTVNEASALGLSAVWRAVSLIAGAVAGLPLRTLEDAPDGTRRPVPSMFDLPAGPDRQTRFEWLELTMVHLLLHGNAYLAHVYGPAGNLLGLTPFHPAAVAVEQATSAPGGKVFYVHLVDGTRREFTGATLTHLTALSVDGLTGLSPIGVARMSLSTAIAGDVAAARTFRSGALFSGIATSSDDLTPDEATAVRQHIEDRTAGVDNAGSIKFINRNIDFKPWSMSAADAQFLESRAFSIEEIGRWYGLPPHLLGQSEKSTSWGTGIEEQNRGLSRYTLAPWTGRVEQRLSLLLPPNRKLEFDYAGFERPSPEDEIRLLIEQVTAGLITVDEARRIRNLPPLPTPATTPPPADDGDDQADDEPDPDEDDE